MVSVGSALRGFVFVFASLMSVLTLSCVTVALPAFFILPFSWQWYRASQDFIQRSWFTFMAFLIEKVFGVKTFCSGDNAKAGDRVLVISNHRCRLDWMFLWNWFVREGRVVNEKIIMKEEMKFMAPFGWSIQSACSIFLKRNWETDAQRIQDSVEHFANKNYPIQLVIFPEGTDKSERMTQRSREFAEAKGLKQLENLLQPRSTGFIHLVKQARKHNLADVVYDLTLGYHPFVAQSEKSFFTGIPPECHVHMTRFNLSDLPEKDEDIEQWLRDRWCKKDQLLDQFNKDGKFSQQPGQPRTHTQLKPESQAQMELWFWSIFHIVLTVVLTDVFFFSSWWALGYFLVFSIGLQLASKKGLETFEIERWKDLKINYGGGSTKKTKLK